MQGLGCRIWGLEFRLWGLGVRGAVLLRGLSCEALQALGVQGVRRASYQSWGFLKLGVPCWVPIKMTLICWGLCWVPRILGNYQFIPKCCKSSPAVLPEFALATHLFYLDVNVDP